MRSLFVLILFFCGLALVACGGDAQPVTVTVSQSGAVQNTTSDFAATETATSGVSTGAISAPTDATAIIAAMTKIIPTMDASVAYDATNDPNNLLGRPGGYSSKATFTDSRIKPSEAQVDAEGAVDLGGGIEVFDNATDAQSRATYIHDIQKSSFLANEYLYVSGGVLLRLSDILTPNQAQAFVDAMGQVLGARVVSATK